jgi:hypothetical protein
LSLSERSIDGIGGIYFAVVLCGGASVGDRSISVSGGTVGMRIDSNYWAIEGWKVTGNGTPRAFEAWACQPGFSTVIHQRPEACVRDDQPNAVQTALLEMLEEYL